MKRITTLPLVALLLATSCADEPYSLVTVRNSTGLPRENETVEIPWSEIPATLDGKLVVADSNGAEIPSQIIYRGGDEPLALLFQASAAPGKEALYTIRPGEPSAYPARLRGRLVPERYDDFAWENERVAYRVYGPALEATGEISNGIDAWVKSVRELVVDKWYAAGDYHRDHGEGLDCYKVGRTLGAGAMAPLVDSALVLGNNFTTARILDQGPIRFTFELTYAPYTVGDSVVTERRVISLDAGAHLNRVEEYYENAPAMEVAAGIILREGEGIVWNDAANGVIAYWEPRNNDNNDDNGHTAVAVIFPQKMKETRQVANHLVGIADYSLGEPFTYHAGAGWSKGGFATPADWSEYVTGELTRINYPLWVTIEKK
ncbi:MAG: DUF4861 domain-containing protein [Odoribacteraceae bacterium]|jgi:hypothetical protein|nr:DUF4861 domain-containing protein [Odoribacteraceae bacterium]